jgi:hypothetical protein
MEGLTQVVKAADAAARWYAHQRRKGASQEPYMNHLLEVAGSQPPQTAVNLMQRLPRFCTMLIDRTDRRPVRVAGRGHRHGSDGRQDATESRAHAAASRDRAQDKPRSQADQAR